MNKKLTNGNFITFGKPSIEEEEINEVVDSLRSGWIGTGPKTAAFEQQFAEYKGVENAVAVNSCTAALHLAMITAGLGEGDEVITTPLTFCATINAIIHSGATPVLADINPATVNIDPLEIDKKITPATRAILPVHMAGRPCDMNSIMQIASLNKLVVIEDCAHAIETEYQGKKAGTIGDLGCFSFYATKNITTAEGGMVIAKNQEHLRRIKTLALHGMSADAWDRYGDSGYKHYYVTELGFKYNMTDIQASLGIHQLNRINTMHEGREKAWNYYNDAFRELPVLTPPDPEENTKHAYHLYTLMIDKERCGISRDHFITAMTDRNIGVGLHYDAIPEHPYYQERYGWKSQDYPNALLKGRQTVSLPLSSHLNSEQLGYIADCVTEIIKHA